MEGKKLNIQFDENMLGSVVDNNMQANTWELLSELLENSLATRREIQGLTNLIQQKDNQIKDVEDKLSELEIKLSVSKERANIYMEKIKDKDDLIAALSLDSTSIKAKLDNIMEVFSTISKQLQNSENKAQIKIKDDQIAMLKSKINTLELELEKSKYEIDSHETTIMKLNKNLKKCVANEKEIRILTKYGTSSKLMHVPGLDPFVPTQEDKIAGPGWIVIQRRLDGSVSFDRDLKTYIEGFGDPLGEFWLGLERMHRITNHQQHELYVHMVDFKNDTHYAHYDNFVVGSEDEKYTLKSLGYYKGDNRDMLRVSQNHKFSTCSDYKMGDWSQDKSVPQCNLNGWISETNTNTSRHIFWGYGEGGKGFFNIKCVQMLIKPINK